VVEQGKALTLNTPRTRDDKCLRVLALNPTYFSRNTIKICSEDNMAGKRQHILPRFLQRGFASNIVSKPNGRETVFTWYYLKGLEPCEITTENVGLEKHFYGKAGELSVDNDITDLEDMFAPVIRELRDKHDGYQITDSTLADFVGHSV
jgi:Protein of unknown function (DUF4238)